MKRIFDWFSHGAWFDFGRETGIREEHDRIIKLLEKNNNCNGGLSSGNCTCAAISLIRGEQKSQSEHLTDAIQTTVFAYEEGEQK